MHRDGTLEKHDVKPSRIKDEMHDMTNSDEGLWFVSRYLAGNTRISERVHKPMLMWAQKMVSTPDALFALRDPRMSGKTDSFTIALPLWIWATLPIENTPVQGVNSCITIVAPKKDIASYIFIANIARRFENAAAYRTLFPWVQPDENFWSLKNGLLLKRTLMAGLPSLYPLGMESVSTSLHPPILIVDDPITEQNYRSATEIRRCVSWIEHSHALTGPVHGVRAIIGNEWALGDVQDQFHPDQEDCPQEYKKVHVWERGITGCDTCCEGENAVYPGGGSISGRLPGHEHTGDIFPIALNRTPPIVNEKGIEEEVPEPPSYIDEVAASKPTFIFLTQHENKLVDPANLHLEKQWLKTWDWHYTPRGAAAIQYAVPIGPGTQAIKDGAQDIRNAGPHIGTVRIVPLYNIDMYLLIDPAPSETTTHGHSRFAAVVVGVDKTSPATFLMDEYADNQPSHKNINRVLDMFVQWRHYIKKVGCEAVGYQATIKDTLLTTAKARFINDLRESMVENLTRLRAEGQQEDRIKYALIPILESGNFYYHPSLRKWRAEYDIFGLKGSKHDLLDATSNLNRVAGVRRIGRGDALNIARKARQRLQSTTSTGY